MSAIESPEALLVELQAPDGRWVEVGLLGHSNEATWFESSESYWSLPERPVLGQIFDERGPSWRPSARVALPTWFSHLLPEGRLREAVAAAAEVKQEREYHLLARIGGDDLPGGLRVRPASAVPTAIPEVEEQPEAQVPTLAPFKFSLAGVQLKFSVSEVDRGLTIPASGDAGTWIAKLPDRRPGFERVPEAELAGLSLARAAGIETPESRLIDVASIAGLPDWAQEGGGKALVVRRFDRTTENRRIHVEELAQVLNVPTGHDRFKYDRVNFETVARSASVLCGPETVGKVIDRIVLNVLVGNGDAHSKNWAFAYPNGQTPVLAPAYDIVPTVLYVSGDDLGLNLRRSTAFVDVRLASFERLADKAFWDGTEGRLRASAAVQRVLEQWNVLEDHLTSEQLERLTAHRDSLPLLHET
jgi:serine/threonine-protein kinase HipA